MKAIKVEACGAICVDYPCAIVWAAGRWGPPPEMPKDCPLPDWPEVSMDNALMLYRSVRGCRVGATEFLERLQSFGIEIKEEKDGK